MVLRSTIWCLCTIALYPHSYKWENVFDTSTVLLSGLVFDTYIDHTRQALAIDSVDNRLYTWQTT